MIAPIKPTVIPDSVARRNAIREQLIAAFEGDAYLDITRTSMGFIVGLGSSTVAVHLRDTGPRDPKRLSWPDVIAVEVGERTGERRIFREPRNKHTHQPKPLRLDPIVQLIRKEIARKDRNERESQRRVHLSELSGHLVMAIEADMPKRRDININTTTEPGCVRLSFAANLPPDVALKVAHAIASVAPPPPPESLD